MVIEVLNTGDDKKDNPLTGDEGAWLLAACYSSDESQKVFWSRALSSMDEQKGTTDCHVKLNGVMLDIEV